MKGVVFNVLGEMVEQKLGLEVWDQVLNQVELASGGAYTVAGSYDDEELLQIVTMLSDMTGSSVSTLIYGAAGHFGVHIDIDHPLCLREGADHCRLKLSFGKSP